MKTNKYLLATLLGLMALTQSCFRLDSNLFSPDNEITEYLHDDYPKTDEWDLVLDASYDIPDSLVHDFTLESQADGETASTTIAVTYLGDISRIATDTVILYCHGNYAHMDVYWQRAKGFANLGGKNRFGLLMMDYRGFGLSEGTASEEGMYADVQACINWLKSMGLTDDRYIMYGFSLGSAPATQLTAHPVGLTPSKLILEAPFASAEMMAQEGTGLAVPGSFFTNLKIDNAEEIKLVQQPFLHIHGIDDHFLSFENHGMSVWNNYHGVYGEQAAIPGAGHSTIVKTMGIEAYSERVLGFVLR